MPIPLIALGAAGAAALVALGARKGGDSAEDLDPTGPAVDTATSPDAGDTVSSNQAIPDNLSARTLSWRAELEAQAPELDVAVLLRWIQRESDGNPASVGSIAQLRRDGWAREAGIGQVYFDSRSSRAFGVTSDELRSGAIDGTQDLARDLTDGERMMQTSSLIAMMRQYIVDGGRVLVGIGQVWSSPDVYCLAKLKHALPVLAGTFLRTCGERATDWDAFRAWAEGLSLDDSLPLYAGSGPYYPWTRYFRNAAYTGRGDST